jgi:2-methylcitrate dehydratase PrpD
MKMKPRELLHKLDDAIRGMDFPEETAIVVVVMDRKEMVAHIAIEVPEGHRPNYLNAAYNAAQCILTHGVETQAMEDKQNG